jgi:hypothetical protein
MRSGCPEADPLAGCRRERLTGAGPSPSLAGRHARGIEQAGSPSSRAGPEGGDSLRLQAEFGKGGVRVSRGGGQRVGENPAVETYVVLGGQLAQLLGRVPLRQRRHIHQIAGGCQAEQRQSLVGGHLVGVEQPVWRSNLLQNLADDLAWRGMGIHNRTSSSVSRLGLGPMCRDRGYERLSAASEMPFLPVGSVAAALVSATFAALSAAISPQALSVVTFAIATAIDATMCRVRPLLPKPWKGDRRRIFQGKGFRTR